MKCRLCGYDWEPRSNEDPKCCPKCKRYDWKPIMKKTTNIKRPITTAQIKTKTVDRERLKQLLEGCKKHPLSEEELMKLADKEDELKTE